MRVPNANTTVQHQSPLIKPPSASSFCYEPTSVLDLGSPLSSSSDKPLPPPPPLPHPVPVPDDASTAPAHLDDPLLHGIDWVSIMNDIGFIDHHATPVLVKSASVVGPDSPDFRNPPPAVHSIYEQGPHVVPTDFEVYPAPGFPHPALSPHHYTGAGGDGYGEIDGGFGSGGFEVLEDLIRASDCIDSNNVQLAQAILARLNQRLRSPLSGKPVHRAAFYFQEALNSLLWAPAPNRPNLGQFSWAEIVQNIRAYKAFSGVSPVTMFTHFTTNQALLESIDGLPTGWTGIFHVIDFDIGFGGQYASFLKEISERSMACKSPIPVVRVTAVVTEEYAVEARLIKENLTQYANEVKVRISIDFILVQTFEMTSFKFIKFMDGEVIAIHLSPTIFRRLGSSNNIGRFMNDVRRVSPVVVVFVDSEPWVGAGGVGAAASFRTNFENCLEYYATLFESIDAAVGSGGDCSDWVRKIEGSLMQPRIAAAVEWAGRRGVLPWREVFHGAGLRGVRMSQFADFQAELLLGKVQVRGFHVAKRQGELVLCWHDRPLVVTSAWRF